MKYFFKNIAQITLIICLSIVLFTSCNKRLESAVPITTTLNSLTINNFLSTDTGYVLFNAAIIKAGAPYTTLISDSSGSTSITVFAPNNVAFKTFINAASGGTVALNATNATFIAFINSLPAATVQGLVGYLIIPGREFVYSDIPIAFPNVQLPSSITIGTLPGTTIPVKLSIFPGRTASAYFLNNTPVTSFDMHYRNGVVHVLSGVITPPSVLLAQMIYADPQFTMFDSLIARGDLGQPNPALKVDSIMKNAGANLTLFAPTNTAVKTFITAASGGLVPSGAPDATFFGFIRTSLPISTAQAIVLYHFLGVRAFGVNFPSVPTFYQTLLNGGIPTHPGVLVQSVFKTTNPLVDSVIKVTGLGTLPSGGAPFSSPAANSTIFDKNAVNGVAHIIDKVLLPQ